MPPRTVACGFLTLSIRRARTQVTPLPATHPFQAFAIASTFGLSCDLGVIVGVLLGRLPLPFSLTALKMFSYALNWKLYRFRRKRKLHSAGGSAALCGMLLAASAPTGSFSSPARAQQTDPALPVVVQ